MQSLYSKLVILSCIGLTVLAQTPDVVKIDTDKDKFISMDELKVWIKHVAEKSANDMTAKHWEESNPQNELTLSWEKYSEQTYGTEEDRLDDLEGVEEYRKVIKTDKRRWQGADKNRDGLLDREEFHHFLHPQDSPDMEAIVIDELLESVDVDKDGFVSENEYLMDVARAYGGDWKPGQPEPDWVKREREQYQRYRDTNGDGKMDRNEVGEWIMPQNYDPIEAEVQHLFYHADTNQDKKLTEEEILTHQDLFVSSEATHYGEELDHEEL